MIRRIERLAREREKDERRDNRVVRGMSVEGNVSTRKMENF